MQKIPLLTAQEEYPMELNKEVAKTSGLCKGTVTCFFQY